jgi:hypothetical protein
LLLESLVPLVFELVFYFVIAELRTALTQVLPNLASLTTPYIDTKGDSLRTRRTTMDVQADGSTSERCGKRIVYCVSEAAPLLGIWRAFAFELVDRTSSR